MRRQHDFFALIRISKHLSSFLQLLNKLCSSLIDGAIKLILSAYNTINDLGVSERDVGMSSKYIANKKGDKTEPCLTPNLMAKVYENICPYLILEKEFFNQFSSRSSNAIGSFLFICFISKAWWFTLSNALLRSILHKLTVLPPLIKRVNYLSGSKNCMIAAHPLSKTKLFIVSGQKITKFFNKAIFK